MVSTEPFVGRQHELERLHRAFDAARDGQGGIALISGEAGIGKTRLCRELESYAVERGARVFWGRAHEGEGAPSYWPWLQAIRPLLDMADGEQLRTWLGGGAGELARLIPELSERLADVSEPEQLADPHAAQFRLFQAATDLLKRAASSAPLVVVLDDLHWADQSTLQLLEQAALHLGRSRVLLAGTYRDVELGRQHPLEQTLAGIVRAERFQTVDLRGLSEPDVATYVGAATGVDLPREALRSVFQETEGNAFFLREVVALMAQEGTLESGGVSVPPSVRAAVGRRLGALSEPCNELLHTAAVVGREFSEAILLRLGLDGADVMTESIESALAAGVIEELERIGEYRFTHALIQETLLGELRTSQRVRLHGRIAEALEEHHVDRRVEQATLLATHYAESSTLSVEHAASAIHYSLLAGHEAKRKFAWGEAVQLYSQAAALFEEAPGPAADVDRAELYASLAGAADSAAQYQLAWRAIMTAAEEYRERGDGVGLARLCPRSVAIWAPSDRLAALLVEAIDLIPDLREIELALHSEVTAALAFYGTRPFVPDPLFEKLLNLLGTRVAAEESNTATKQALLSIESWNDIRGGDLPTVITSYQELQDWTHTAWQLAGEIDNARRAAAVRAQDPALDRTVNAINAAVLMNLAIVRADAGEFERLSSEYPFSFHILDLLRSIQALEQGDIDRAVDLLPDPSSAGGVPHALAYLLPARCAVLWRAGRRDEAASEYRRALDESEAAGYRGLRAGAELQPVDLFLYVNAPSMFDVAAVHLANEHERAALEVIIRSQPGFTAGRVVGWPWCNQRVYADWALVLGMDEDAARLFTDALQWCERERCPVEAGRCHQGLAEVAVRRDQTPEALRHLDAAIALFEPHGAELFVDQARRRQDELRATSLGRTSHSDGLSNREIEVLRLVAAGSTNAQIAEQLVIASGTVARHVSNILNKTGLHNRTELAAYAVAQGLTDS